MNRKNSLFFVLGHELEHVGDTCHRAVAPGTYSPGFHDGSWAYC